MEVGRKGMPHCRQPAAMKPMSNSALWAARGRSPTKSRKARRASSWEGAPSSISSVMPVSSVISGVRGRSGSAKVEKLLGDLPVFQHHRADLGDDVPPVVQAGGLDVKADDLAVEGLVRSPWTATRSSTSLMK